MRITNTVPADSKGLFDTISVLQGGAEYGLKNPVPATQDSFDSTKRITLGFLQEKLNIVDFLRN